MSGESRIRAGRCRLKKDPLEGHGDISRNQYWLNSSFDVFNKNSPEISPIMS